MGNSIGNLFRLTTFGESHGVAIGGVIDGCPAGLELDIEEIQKQLDRRRPGQSKISTQRNEIDRVKILSGIFEGVTTGTPIGFIIKNKDSNIRDYAHIKDVYRPSHADFTYMKKYGLRDYRGGGRSSARETANWIVAGAIAQQILDEVSINAYVSSVGSVFVKKPYQSLDFSRIDNNIVRCPDEKVAKEMIREIKKVKKEGDTIGGTIICVVKNIPSGWGEPVFDKLHADIGKAMLSINAVRGFEFGAGFSASRMKGSDHNDVFLSQSNTKTNFSAGIQGGISNGNDIYCRVAFKPVATIKKKQTTINTEGENVEIEGKGRHDVCVVPRAVPIVESMMAFTLLNSYLRSKTNKIND